MDLSPRQMWRLVRLGLEEEIIRQVEISGDFFFFPVEGLRGLERALVGRRVDQVKEIATRFYAEQGVESPGVTTADLAQVIG